MRDCCRLLCKGDFNFNKICNNILHVDTNGDTKADTRGIAIALLHLLSAAMLKIIYADACV